MLLFRTSNIEIVSECCCKQYVKPVPAGCTTLTCYMFCLFLFFYFLCTFVVNKDYHNLSVHVSNPNCSSVRQNIDEYCRWLGEH